MEKMLTLALLVNAIISANITVYPEHNPLGADYLHIHIDKTNLVTKNGPKDSNSKPVVQADRKIIYELPLKLDHDETFVIKICPKGTIDTFTAATNKDEVLKTCLSDNYGSLIGFNHYAEVPLYQFRIHTFYKTCFFGGASSEAERSLHIIPVDDIIKNVDYTKSELFYTKPEDIMKKYEDSKDFKYRLENSSPDKEDFRCTLQFNIAGFDLDSFEDRIHFEKNTDTASVLIIEYNADKFIVKTDAVVDKREFPKNKDGDINDRREQVVKQLAKSTYFAKSSFDNTKLTYSIAQANKASKGIPLKIKLSQQSHVNKDSNLKVLDFPLELNDKEYVRFVPLVCKMMLTSVETSSYMFLNSKDCTVVGNDKVLITGSPTGLKFVSKQHNSSRPSESVTLNAVTMDFEYYAKNEPETIFIIKGLEDRSDAVYDAERRIVYHISYQKLIIKSAKDKKEVPTNEDQVPKTIPIKINGKDKVQKRLLGSMDNWQKFGLLLITVFSCVLMGAVYFWGSTILAMISFFIIILCLIFIGIRNQDRILAGGEVEYNKKSFVELLDKDSLALQKARIVSLSNVTPDCFTGEYDFVTKSAKGDKQKVSKIIVDLLKYNALVKKVEDDSQKTIKQSGHATDFKKSTEEDILLKEKENTLTNNI